MARSNGLLHVDQMRDVKTIFKDAFQDLSRPGLPLAAAVAAGAEMKLPGAKP